METREFSALPDVERMSATAGAYRVLERCAPPITPGASSFAGKLLLCTGLGERGFAYSLAMSIAGGTFLGLEPRPQRLKEALRDGVCDYMVNSLDEALRVLKNEIRKKAPVSIGLLGDIASVLQDAIERGFQPDYVVAGSSAAEDGILKPFEQRGAVRLSEADRSDVSAEAVDLVVASAATSTLREFERLVATVLARSPASQLKWAESSARYFRRTTPPMRSALMAQSQTAALENQLTQQPLDGEMMLAVQCAATSEWRLRNFGPGNAAV